MPPNPEQRTPSRRRLVVGSLAVLAALAVLSAVLFTGDVAFLSRFCGSCHTIAPAVRTWERGPHAQIGCYGCHEPSGALPVRLVRRTTQLGREVVAHLADGTVDRGPYHEVALQEETCLRCHDPARTPTSGGGVIIDHEEHAERNSSCVSCHLGTAHPLPDEDQAIFTMGQCFECHGSSQYPTASRQCEACHPNYYELLPASHEPADTWTQPRHGKVALDDREQCSMCHLANYCTQCHLVDMPHPDDWLTGEAGHKARPADDAPICAQCHEAAPDSCSTCHHSEHDPANGPWAENHYHVARAHGTVQCVECHAADFCHGCHELDPLTSEGP